MAITEQASRKAYLDEHVPVRIIHTDEIGYWVYAVEVVDSDSLWLDSFTTEYGARQFVEYHKLQLPLVVADEKPDELVKSAGE